MIELVDRFVRDSLLAAGAVVEPDADVLHVLLPSEKARSLELPEELRVTTSARAVHVEGTGQQLDPRQLAFDAIGARAERRIAGCPPETFDASLGSPLLDRLVALRLSQTVVVAISFPGELPRGLPGDVPVLLNAVRRGEAERKRESARYAVADLLLALHGDETRSAVASVSIRLADGATVAALPLMQTHAIAAAGAGSRGGFGASERDLLARGLHAWVARGGLLSFASALEGVARRARRDLERLADYYRSLDADMARAVHRARSEEEKARRRAKRDLLPGEMAARKEQLRERLRPRLAARLLAIRLVETEVDQFTIAVQRRARSGVVTVQRRAGDGALEGPACAGCGQATLRVYLCDDRLHALCADCGQDGHLDGSRCPACTPGLSKRPPGDTTPHSVVVPDAAGLLPAANEAFSS